GLANMGGAPLIARSAAELMALRIGASTRSTSFTGIASPARRRAFASKTRSAPSAAPEPATAPLAFMEVLCLDERGLNYRHKHKLGQALHGSQLEGDGAAIPAAHHQLTLVVGIDKPDQIAENDFVFMPKAGPGQNQCRERGVGDVYGDSGRDE